MEPALVIGFDPDAFFEAANDGKMLTDIKNAASTVNGLTYIANRLKTGVFASDTLGSGKRGKGRFKKKGDSGGKTSLFSKLTKRS